MSEKTNSTVDNDSIAADGAKNRRIVILQLQYLLSHYIEDIEDINLKKQASNIINNLFINIVRDGSLKVESKKFMQVVVPSDDGIINPSMGDIKTDAIKHWQEMRRKAEQIFYDAAKEKDMVNNPDHYQSMVKDLNIDAITCMRAAYGDEDVKSFCLCNAFKYLFRCYDKGRNEDIKKAQWYLDKFMELGGMDNE